MIHVVPLPRFSSKWTINTIDFNNKSLESLSIYVAKATINSSRVRKDEVNVNLYMVSKKEMMSINKTHRNKDCPTNVIACSSDAIPIEIDAMRELGDVYLCRDVINEESQKEGKLFEDHLAHMIVHGILHLLGYDHEKDQQEIRM